MFSRLLLVILISIILTSKTNAETCDAYFPDTVQGHASGSEIEFEDEGLILGDIDNHFLFSELDDETENSHKTCGVSDCTVSGGSAPAIELPDFEATNNGNDLTIEGWGAPLTIDDSEIQKLTITDGAKVTFLSTGSPFKIKEGIFKEQSKITLQTGVYWFNELTIQNDVKIYIEGPVIIYVKTDLLIKNQAQVNFNKNSNGQNGDGEAKDLVFVTWSDDVELIDNVKVRALLYSKSVEMSEEAKFIGAISVEDELSIENEATVYYEDVSGAICGAPTPTLPEAKVEWRFDECTYTGSGNEVIDHSNNGYDATIHGITSPVQGQINNALDLSASGISDWVSVPRKAIHN
ncbi:MAG: hypothetical protein GY787_15440, partial [Alteromonadales bacterium]|nr:hypothetical protein [Alteromonadales bacterium]